MLLRHQVKVEQASSDADCDAVAQQPSKPHTPYSTFISSAVIQQPNGAFIVAQQKLKHSNKQAAPASTQKNDSQDQMQSGSTDVVHTHSTRESWPIHQGYQQSGYMEFIPSEPVFMVSLAGIEPMYYIDSRYVLRCHLSVRQAERINSVVLECLGHNHNIVSPRCYQPPYPIGGGLHQYDLKIVQHPSSLFPKEDILLVNSQKQRVPFLDEIYFVTDVRSLNTVLQQCCDFSKNVQQELTKGNYNKMIKIHGAINKFIRLTSEHINDGMQRIIYADIIQAYGKNIAINLILGLYFALRNTNTMLVFRDHYQRADLLCHINGLINLIIFTPMLHLLAIHGMPYAQHISAYENAWLNPTTFIIND